MKLKLSLRRPGGDGVTDIVVTVDPTVAVGDVATAIAAVDPAGGGRSAMSLTLSTGDASSRAVRASVPIGRAGIRSGQLVGVVDAPVAYEDPGLGSEAATLVVDSGPDQGRTFPLTPGSNYVGRGPGNDVELDDQMVSKQHARIDITDVVEIIDRGSVNGVVVGDAQVARAVLQPHDRVLLGDTQIRIVPRALDVAANSAATIPFNRSPRLDPRFPGERFTSPEVPAPPQLGALPVVAFIAPLLLGAALFAITRSAQAVLFVALSPILMIGTFVEQRLSGRRSYRRATALFRGALADLDRRLAEANALEATARRAEHPSPAEVLDSAASRTPLLWTRRPDRPGYLELRLGLGRRPSRHQVEQSATRPPPGPLTEELNAVVARWKDVEGVPVVAELKTCGSLGVAGPRRQALPVATGLVIQLIGLHSPAEVALCAIGSSASAADWAWLRWLPHVSSEHHPVEDPLADSTPSASALVAALDTIIAERLEADSGRGSGARPSVVLLVEDDAPVERSLLVSIAERGAEADVHVLWIAATQADLPAACATYLTVDGAGAGWAGDVLTAEHVGVVAEPVDRAPAELFARGLAPVIDSGARVDDDSDLPRSVALLNVLDPAVGRDEATVLDRWRQSGSLGGDAAVEDQVDRGLRATVGLAVGGELTLDLRTQGPHALVGGTTGAGKSEFLQSWVAALASTYSPARLNFLFVDYKGGSAFRDCIALPHTVGLVTDLTPHLVQRALLSLNAELQHRERILETRRAKDVLELERRGDPDAPPSLVIVVDEFAALVQEVPEFVDGVVNVAQRGRSLGLHLILATQRPAGVIRENLRANTNLRIALRMADADDSENVVGSPQAAFFDPDVPGRAVVRSGPSQIQRFQAGYAGGRTSDRAPAPEVVVEELRFGPPLRWSAQKEISGVSAPTGPTDLHRLVETVRRAFTTSGLPLPRRPWLKELADVYDLSRAPQSRTDESLVFGVQDEPQSQSQTAVSFMPDRDGSMAIFGTGGSGKTTVLRTLAVVAGLSSRGGPCHVYGLDFGARGLQALEPLPHVGAIIGGDDHERLTRLLRWIREQIDERATRYAAARAGTIVEYRRLAGQPDEPRLLLLIDGLAAFRNAYETADRLRWLDALNGIAADGRQVGVHLVITADRLTTVPASLAASIQRRLVLRLAGEQEYGLADVRADVLGPSSPPGRGIIDGLEVQVAVLGGSPNLALQARAIDRLAEEVRRALPRPAPHPIGRLADRVALSELPPTIDGRPALGIADDTLEPIGFRDDGTLFVVGPPSSGRSTALATIARSFHRARPTGATVFLGARRSSLWALPDWAERAAGEDEVADLAARLTSQIIGGRVGPSSLLVVLEGVPDLVDSVADYALVELVRACGSHNVGLVAEAESSAASGYGQLLQALRAPRYGFLLQPEQHDGDQLFKAPLPRLGRADMPPGRGFVVQQGRAALVQCALPELDL